MHTYCNSSPHNVVTKLRARRPAVRFPAGESRPAVRPKKWVVGVIVPVVKRSERDAHPTAPSRAEVTNKWGCTATPPVRLHSVDGNNLFHPHARR